MCAEGRPAGHPELWLSTLPESQGPEADFELWREAEERLDSLCTKAEEEHWNEGAYCALVDGYNRAIEERRRAADLLKLHEKWSRRRVGGVVEPAE